MDVKNLETHAIIGFDGSAIRGLKVHPDGNHIVYPMGNKVCIQQWVSKQMWFLSGHSNSVSAVGVSPGGRYVGSGQINHVGFKAAAKLWDFKKKTLLGSHELHKVRVEALMFSSDERYMISLGGRDDGCVVLWDCAAGAATGTAPAARLTTGDAVAIAPLSCRPNSFVTGGESNLRVWNISAGSKALDVVDVALGKLRRTVRCIAISEDDSYGVAGTTTGDLVKFSIKYPPDPAASVAACKPALIGCLAKCGPWKKGKKPESLCYSPGVETILIMADGCLIVGAGDGTIDILDEINWKGEFPKGRLLEPNMPYFKALKSAKLPGCITSLELMESPSQRGVARKLLAATRTSEIYALSVDTLAPVLCVTCHRCAVNDIAFPRGMSGVFATAGAGDVRVWCLETCQELLRVSVPNFTCSSVLFSGDGKSIVSGWNDGTIRAFTPLTGRLMYCIFNTHNKGTSALAMNSKGNTLISGGCEGQVRVWDIKPEKQMLKKVLKEHKSPVSALQVSPNDCEAVSAGTDGSCIIWDLMVHQLLVSSLDKLNTKGNTTLIYNESMATLEKLSILKAWAEVYIVAMVSNNSAPGSYIKQLDSKPINNRAEIAKWRNQLLRTSSQVEDVTPDADDEYGDFESKGESLLRLVEPELESLGENWIAALKDHALLSLPPEFASQLPHGGGAFYSAETAEASRAHYARAWPALLYAAALRYNANVDSPAPAADKSENTLDNRANKTENGNFEFFEPIDERFHLLFGICMEALCAQRDMTIDNTITVLLSIVTLLDAPGNRARLLKDKALAIELCQIVHRTGLTLESVEALLLVADVLKLIITGAREQLQANMQAKIKELAPNESANNIPQSVLEVVHTLGEGGPTGDLPPGKSLVFACLEVCVCLAVRRLPGLSPRKQEGAVGVIGVPRGLGVHGDALLVSTLAAMGDLTSLTSPQGALSLLPTILYLSLGVLGECSDATLADAAVLLLQQASAAPAPRVSPHTRAQHARLLHSALAKLLEKVKSDEIGQRIDPVIGARAMAVLLNHSEPTPPLHYPCINHFRQCLETRDNEVFARCCSVIRTVWSRAAPPPCVSWWARALAARVAARAAAARRPADAAHARAAVAAVSALDDLLNAAPEHARIQLLWLLVPIVISYLREGSELARAPPHARALHDFALQWLTRVGPKHPQEFKTMMSQSAELRSKLETAVKSSQAGARGSTRDPPSPPYNSRPTSATSDNCTLPSKHGIFNSI